MVDNGKRLVEVDINTLLFPTELEAAMAARFGGGGGGGSYPPAGGVPKSDMDAAVQVSLGKADTALQSVPGVLGTYLGAINGTPVQPWKEAVPYGIEYWRLNNMLGPSGPYNTTVINPSLTANGTNQTLRTLCEIGNMSQRDRNFRLRFRIVSMPTNGWGAVSLAYVNAAGTIISGTQEQLVRTLGMPSGTINEWIEMDISSYEGLEGASQCYLELRLNLVNNATTGTMLVDNVSLQEVGAPSFTMKFGNSGGVPSLFIPLRDPLAKKWNLVAHRFDADGAITNAMRGIDGFSYMFPFQNSYADPTFKKTTGGVTSGIPEAGGGSIPNSELWHQLRGPNNDHIYNVMKSDNTYELRGNSHGGETLLAGAANLKWEYDIKGDNNWLTWDGTVNALHDCRRFRFTYNTELKRSAPDSNQFMTATHKCSYYPDGMMRMDRVCTFTADTRINTIFEWMSSHDPTVPFVGRLGNGLILQGENDSFAKVARPATPTPSTSTTGGVLPAATYSYQITALSEGGETDGSAVVTQVTTGSTSRNTITWSLVSNATGYRIYGRSGNAFGRFLLATVGPTTTSWIDDGTLPIVGPGVPQYNTARRMNYAGTVQEPAFSHTASWAAWYDPQLNIVFSNIFDRDAIALRPNISNAKVRLLQGKNYVSIWPTPDGGGPAFPPENMPSRLYTTGTVWSATHWAYTYVPSDRLNWHTEVAVRSSDLTALKALYPTL